MRAQLFSIATAARVSGTVTCLVAAAATAIDVSPDVTVELGATTFYDDEIAEDTGGGGLLIPIGALPESVEVVGYEDIGGGKSLLSFDTTVALSPGAVTAEPRDVVRWDGATWSLEFDGSAEGAPGGASVDAVAATDTGDLLLSFDVTIDLPGLSGVSDEEIVQFDGATFSTFFDGTALGADAVRLDTDALTREPAGVLRLSFDGSGQLGGVEFDDEDALDYDPGAGTWVLAYDGSASDPSWAAADLVAIPEPSAALGLAASLALLAALVRRRAGLARGGESEFTNLQRR